VILDLFHNPTEVSLLWPQELQTKRQEQPETSWIDFHQAGDRTGLPRARSSYGQGPYRGLQREATRRLLEHELIWESARGRTHHCGLAYQVWWSPRDRSSGNRVPLEHAGELPIVDGRPW